MIGPDRPGVERIWPAAAVLGAAVLGLVLIADQAYRLSATYDEVTYLRVGARWWRTGEQEAISRMGSPLTFWKLQQAPTLWVVDHFGDPRWVDDPIGHQAALLPWVRIGGSWPWAAALLVVAAWARCWYGDRAMAFAAATFALSPNLLAHGALATMEAPLVASTAGLLFAFGQFLRTGRRRYLRAAAAVAGLAFSCKFTTALIPPILGLAWGVQLWLRRDRGAAATRQAADLVRTLAAGMAEFVALMLLANLVVTGFALIPLSPRSGSHPILDRRLAPGAARWGATVLEWSFPQDWVGFATQVLHQKNGGPSYLLGEVRRTGWWYYYPVTLAVKVPLAAWFLLLVRARWRGPGRPDRADPRSWLVPLVVGAFLLAAMAGSKRNYGVRYLLPLAPAAIVWTSALAAGGRGLRRAGAAGLAGMALAVASAHPYELAYFNALAGGTTGGRHILADSNLDWGQGAVAMARLQAECPAYRDLTWYAFGDTDPAHYGVVGRRYLFDANRAPADLPPAVRATTCYLAVSASLQWGPWGPPGYFRALDRVRPVRYSADGSVAIYRTADLDAAIRTGPARE